VKKEAKSITSVDFELGVPKELEIQETWELCPNLSNVRKSTREFVSDWTQKGFHLNKQITDLCISGTIV